MPIRTNRGRGAVYRKLWAWPLRSPRHLMIAAFVLAVLAIAIGFIVPKASDPLSGGAPTTPVVTLSNGMVVTVTPGAAGTTAAGASSTTTSAVPRVTVPPPSTAPPAPEALAVAEAWARAWVNHPAGMTSEEWTAQLAPLTTEEYLPQLRTVDPANIPSTTVTGKAEAITSSARAVDVKIATDGAELRLTVIATDSGWRVSAFNRAD
jgi:hypothetical protein